jgi:hypothetical protein
MSTRATLAIGEHWHLYVEMLTGEVEIELRHEGMELTFALPRQAVEALRRYAYSNENPSDEPSILGGRR